jgi:hypothetical protein
LLTAKEQRKLKEVENAHELKKFDHEIQLRKAASQERHEAHEDAMDANQQMTEADLAKTVVKGSYDGLIASINADKELKGGVIIDGLRASVRPVLTYGSVGFATFMAWYGVSGDVQEAASWSLLTNASMAFAWWFGDRQSVKLNSKYLKG